MREIHIDLSSDNYSQNPKVFGGYAGEHNESKLIVKLPDRMIRDDIDYYYFEFQTVLKEHITSPNVYKNNLSNDNEISIILWEQLLPSAGNLNFCVNAINLGENDTVTIKGKTSICTLHISESPNGKDVLIDPKSSKEELQKSIDSAIAEAINTIPQSNWNKNDETKSDYIKNRTHYTYTESVTTDTYYSEGSYAHPILDRFTEEHIDETWGYTLNTTYVKISDSPDIDIVGSIITVEYNDSSTTTMSEEITITRDIIIEVSPTEWSVGVDLHEYVRIYDNDKSSGRNGIYLLSNHETSPNTSYYVRSLDIKTPVERVKKLDAKYIPFENYYTKTEVDENTNKSLKKQTRSQVVPVNNYDYNLDSVPYLYGNYGNIINHQETQGLIKASMGGVIQRIIDKINADISSGALSEEEGNELITLIKRGMIPQQYKEMLDYHTIAIKDGNAAIPVGYHDFKLDKDGNIIDSKLWYGTAAPCEMIFEKASYGELIPIARGRDNPNDTTVRGWDTGLQQVIDPKSETSGLIIRNKNPHAAELIEKHYQDIVKNTGLKVNPDSKQPLGALGLYTASFGGASSAQGKRAFACGTSTVAIGKYSFACGDNAVTLGNESFATGYNTVTLGKRAFAAGIETQAIGEGSVVTGSYNISNGALSFTGGQDCVTGATALRSFAYGKGLKTTSNDQFIIGKFNNNKTDTIFEVGYGSNSDNRSNVFEVYNDGHAEVKIVGTTGNSIINKKYVDDKIPDNIKNSTGSSSLQQVQDTGYTGIAIKTKNPNAYALDNTLTDNEPIGATGAFASSFGGVTSAQGKRSFACGTNTIAKGKYSFASGDNAVALGNESFVSGYNTVAKGSQSFAIGSGTQAIGQNSVSTGSNNISNGGNSFTGGQDCVTGATALRSFAYGKGLKTTSNDQFVIGMYNVGNKDNIFEIGYGYSDTNRQNSFYVTKEGFAYIQNSMIMSEADFVKQMSSYYGLGKGLTGGVQGSNCLATNTTDTAFGNNTQATAGASMATGVETQANGLHSFAGGNNSIAGYANQFIVGKFNSNKPDTYFEVGNGADNSNRSNAFEVYADGHAEISAMGSTDKSVTTKKYVDDIVGNIETLLGGI